LLKKTERFSRGKQLFIHRSSNCKFGSPPSRVDSGALLAQGNTEKHLVRPHVNLLLTPIWFKKNMKRHLSIHCSTNRLGALHARPGGSADYWCTLSCHVLSFRSRFCDCMREASPTLALECGKCDNMKHVDNSNKRGSNGYGVD
jgi:hypothetical protein